MLRIGLAGHGRTMAFAALIGFGSMSIAAPRFGRDVARLEEIQGVWNQVSGEWGGKPMIERPYRLEVKGDAYTETETDTISSDLAIDATKSPVTYDEIVHYPRPNAFTVAGILKVSGNQLVRAIPRVLGRRPSTFEPKPNDLVVMETWEREGDFPPPDIPVARQLEGRWRLVSQVADGRMADLSWRSFRMQISGKSIVRTVVMMKSGRIVLQQGSNRFVLDQTSTTLKMAGLIDLDPEEKILRFVVNTHDASNYPDRFVTGPDRRDKLRVLRKDECSIHSRPL